MRLFLVLLFATCAVGSDKPIATRADAKAAAKAEAAVIDAAVAELKKEYAAHLKDPAKHPLRPQCTFFLDHPAQLSPASVVTALEAPVGTDPRLVAYVRWQLLSAAPNQFEADGKLLPRVIDAYRRAPAPAPRFGLSAEDQSKLDAMLRDARREDDARLSVALEELAAKQAESNKPILAYRDELYARLPPSYESLAAGFEDAAERAAVAAGGGTSDVHAARVVKDAQAWAQSGTADPKQCAQLADGVARLRHTRSPPYYARASARRGEARLSWSTRTDAVYSPTKLSNLEKVLREAHKNGLALKPEPAKAVKAASAAPKK